MTKRVTVLGTGIMGSGMARSLARAGLDVTVWNRHRERARALADVATVAADAPSAVAGADVVVTILFDVDAVASVMAEALPSFGPSTVWAQCTTVGLDGTARLAAMAREAGVGFIDSPVQGTRVPAEQGKLTVLAAGPPSLREQVTPVYDAIGSRTLWLGEEPGAGHRFKLVSNSWVLGLTAATAQTLEFARGIGLDPQVFLDFIAGGPLDNGYAQTKGKAIIAGEFPADFTLDGAHKDAGLIADAMDEVGVNDALMRAMHARFGAAADAGHGSEDMAAVAYSFRE